MGEPTEHVVQRAELPDPPDARWHAHEKELLHSVDNRRPRRTASAKENRVAYGAASGVSLEGDFGLGEEVGRLVR
jgi:hypothetical protein